MIQIVQDGSNTQCYNKYSYCLNNPLKYTDPSGWTWSPISGITSNTLKAAAMQLRADVRRMQAEMNRVMPEPCYNTGANRLQMSGNNGDGGRVYSPLEVAFYMNTVLNIMKEIGVIPDGGDDECTLNNTTSNEMPESDNIDNLPQNNPLSSPRDFANELKYYFKYNSGTEYKLTKERFNDICENASKNNAIEWENATKMEDGRYSIPVNFYLTDYDLAFGRATMYFTFYSSAGFEPVGFYDFWDLDPKPLGERSIPSEMITRYYNWKLGNGTSFSITYP